MLFISQSFSPSVWGFKLYFLQKKKLSSLNHKSWKNKIVDFMSDLLKSFSPHNITLRKNILNQQNNDSSVKKRVWDRPKYIKIKVFRTKTLRFIWSFWNSGPLTEEKDINQSIKKPTIQVHDYFPLWKMMHEPKLREQ